ncbi:MAG: hypothetical protein PHD48_07880 [Alphaproteobacteria bacterium]|nr:hypothetical protein [Alphaproteobacteria bacterium]
MKSLFKIVVILSLISVSGCVPFWRKWMHDDAAMKPSPTAMKAHESWCYQTLGAIDCYPGPQRISPESLVSVDPPSRRPLTRQDYVKAVSDYELRK